MNERRPSDERSGGVGESAVTLSRRPTIAPAAWYPEVHKALQELLRLSPGWDLYNARQISTGAVERAYELLEAAMLCDTPAPSIVPMSQGGVQLEWHLRGLNIEVTIPSTGAPVEVWHEDVLMGDEREFIADDDRGALRDTLTELTRRR